MKLKYQAFITKIKQWFRIKLYRMKLISCAQLIDLDGGTKHAMRVQQSIDEKNEKRRFNGRIEYLEKRNKELHEAYLDQLFKNKTED